MHKLTKEQKQIRIGNDLTKRMYLLQTAGAIDIRDSDAHIYEDKEFTKPIWRYEVHAGETLIGYYQWAFLKIRDRRDKLFPKKGYTCNKCMHQALTKIHCAHPKIVFNHQSTRKISKNTRPKWCPVFK
jgi:hypothetical protein